MRILLSTGMYGFVSLGILFWVYLGYRFLNYPENHLGWNILWSLLVFGILGLLSTFEWFRFGSKLSIFLLGFSVVSSILVLCMYYFNVFVPYEIWLKRGMPERPF